jgi:SAM-dependent methyltransferase
VTESLAGPVCPVCLDQGSRFFAAPGGRTYWRCQCCEATFLDPAALPDRSVEEAEYRLHVNDIDDSGYRRFLAQLADPLLAILPPGSEGLDFGCGPGPALAAMLREAGHAVALYDPLFFDDTRLLDRRYDFVCCSEVVEHFHRPADAFAQLDGLLRPGAWLGVMTQFLGEGVDFERWHYRRDLTHVVFYCEQTFRVLAQHHGWSCEIPATNIALMRKPVV